MSIALTIILFLLIGLSVPTSIALIIGLSLSYDSAKDCQSKIDMVKKNELLVKIIMILISTLSIIGFALSVVLLD